MSNGIHLIKDMSLDNKDYSDLRFWAVETLQKDDIPEVIHYIAQDILDNVEQPAMNMVGFNNTDHFLAIVDDVSSGKQYAMIYGNSKYIYGVEVFSDGSLSNRKRETLIASNLIPTGEYAALVKKDSDYNNSSQNDESDVLHSKEDFRNTPINTVAKSFKDSSLIIKIDTGEWVDFNTNNVLNEEELTHDKYIVLDEGINYTL